MGKKINTNEKYAKVQINHQNERREKESTTQKNDPFTPWTMKLLIYERIVVKNCNELINKEKWSISKY